MSDEGKSFTSWKLTLWDAISMDAEIGPTERLVAWRLLQHANAKTRAIFPTQRRIAIQLGVSVDTVKASVAILMKRGWFRVDRENRRQSNRYTPVDTLVEGILEDVLDKTDNDVLRGKKRTLKKNVRGWKCTLVRGEIPTRVTGEKYPPNTLSEPPEGNTLIAGATKGEVPSTERDRVSSEPSKSERAETRSDSELDDQNASAVLERTPIVRDLVRQVGAGLRVVVDPKVNLDALDQQRLVGGRR